MYIYSRLQINLRENIELGIKSKYTKKQAKKKKFPKTDPLRLIRIIRDRV